MQTTRTEYILGFNSRLENRTCLGHSDVFPSANVRYEYGPLRAYIQNLDLQYGFEIDMDGGVYTAWRTNRHGSPAWIKPRRIKPQAPSGSTIHSHTDTIDTGERRTMFGYTARRVITRNTSRRDAALTSESESDGWYIDPPAAWLNLHPGPGRGAFMLCSAEGRRDDFRFSESGERETGFRALVASTNRSYFRDQEGAIRSHESSHREEVTEFSEAALDPKVFIPPGDFKRVMQLPGSICYPFANRLQLRWEMLKDSYRLRKKLAQ